MMTNIIKWKSLHPCSDIGLFDITLPFGVVGSGNAPIVTLTAMIHGDEPAGLLVLQHLIETLIPKLNFIGTLRFVPIANPLAAITNTRCSFLDRVDQNRIGIGNISGNVSEIFADSLFNLVSDSNLVVNFHEFEGDAALTCVYSNVGSKKIKNAILSSMKAFDPEIIWKLPGTKNDGHNVPTSFDARSALNGVPVFSIELPRHDMLNPNLLTRCVEKIVNLLVKNGVVTGKTRRNGKVISVERKVIYSRQIGIWSPQKKIMDKVQKGEVIGEITSLPEFDKNIFVSPYDGYIIQTRPKEVVRPSDILFAVGC